MTFSLRAATVADLPQLEAWSYAFERDDGHPAGDPGPVFIAETLRHFAANPTRGEVLVIERDDAPIGYAILTRFWSNEFRGEAVILDELYIDGPHRGGAGALVIPMLVDRARCFGAKVISLEVLDANPRVATLYGRHGFATERRSYWRKL